MKRNGSGTDRHALDDVDWKVLKILQADGRTALSEIARRLDMGAATIHERANTLEEQGYIREYRALLDPELLGINEVGFIRVDAEAGRASEVAERLTEEPDIQEIHEVTGEADLLLKVRVRDKSGLTGLLKTIGEYEGVEATATNIALRTVQEQSKLNLDSE